MSSQIGRKVVGGVLVLFGALVANPALADGPGAMLGATPLVVIAGGDVLLDRGVRSVLQDRQDPASLFGEIAPHLRAADLSLANLECTLVDSSAAPLLKRFVFRGDPSIAASLRTAGFDGMSVANNHSTDFGRASLLATVEHLRAAGISPIGAGRNREDAFSPEVIEIAGWRISLLGFADMRIEGLPPLDDAPMPAMGDTAELVRAVRSARQNGDLVIVLLHWGQEYEVLPTERQRSLGRRLAEAGADLLIGSHPHVLQPIERIGKTIVCYSLGNLVFDQERRECRETALVRVTFPPPRGTEQTPCEGCDVPAVEIIPFVIDHSTPRAASEEESCEIRGRLFPLAAR